MRAQLFGDWTSSQFSTGIIQLGDGNAELDEKDDMAFDHIGTSASTNAEIIA